MPPMSSEESGKTKATGLRIPLDLLARLESVKGKEAHKRVPNSDLFIEAITLYVGLAEEYGLDEDLRPKCVYEVSKKNYKPASNGQ